MKFLMKPPSYLVERAERAMENAYTGEEPTINLEWYIRESELVIDLLGSGELEYLEEERFAGFQRRLGHSVRKFLRIHSGG